MIRVLLVDDEPPARKRMRHLLRSVSDVEIVGEAGTGSDAISAATAHTPDLILLDIHLPDMDGFEVLTRLPDPESVAVIFVTAYDEHALAAFHARALDYLLKPVAPDRFEAALDRARKVLARQPERYARRFLVTLQVRAIFVAVEAVERLESARNYVLLHSGSETYIMRTTLDAVQRRLDPEQFARVNRSAIVNVERIQELRPWTNGEYQIVMKGGSEVMWTRRHDLLASAARPPLTFQIADSSPVEECSTHPGRQPA
jgi:two-component system LytT family response regulator